VPTDRRPRLPSSNTVARPMPELAPVVRETRSFVIGASFQCHPTLPPDYRGPYRKVAARDPDHVRVIDPRRAAELEGH